MNKLSHLFEFFEFVCKFNLIGFLSGTFSAFSLYKDLAGEFGLLTSNWHSHRLIYFKVLGILVADVHILPLLDHLLLLKSLLNSSNHCEKPAIVNAVNNVEKEGSVNIPGTFDFRQVRFYSIVFESFSVDLLALGLGYVAYPFNFIQW